MSSSNQFSDQVDNSSSAPAITVGATLREAREKAGLNRDELARRLCMTPDKLEALEQDAFGRFAGATYVRGYIRNLCKELGLDTATVLEAFARQVPVEVAAQPVRTPVGSVMTSRREKQGGSLFVPFVLVLAVAAGGGYWWFDQQSGSANQLVRVDSEIPATVSEHSPEAEAVDGAEFSFTESAGDSETLAGAEADGVEPAEEDVADDGAPETDAEFAEVEAAEVEAAAVDSDFGANAIAEARPARNSDAPSPVAMEVPAEVSPAAPAVADVAPANEQTVNDRPEAVSAARRLVISFQQESWVEVTDATGYKMLAKLQPAGSTVQLDGRAPFSVMLGNAAGATITYDGQTIDSAPIGNRRTRKLTVGE